jgi:hypothetical protein
MRGAVRCGAGGAAREMQTFLCLVGVGGLESPFSARPHRLFVGGMVVVGRALTNYM